MSRYVMDALEELYPCRVEGSRGGVNISICCRYLKECSAYFGDDGSRPRVCISRMAFEDARYVAKGSTFEKEEGSLIKALEGCEGASLLDPQLARWDVRVLDKSEIPRIAAEILKRGQGLYNSAVSTGNERDPSKSCV